MKIRALSFAIGAAFAVASIDAADHEPPVRACQYTPAALQSWKTLFSHQVGVLDPKKADQLSRVAAEIIDGRVEALKVEINGGVSPDATLLDAGGAISLLDLAVAACQDSVARELVASGANPDGVAYSVPLVTAAGNGEAALLEFLLSRGAAVDKIDANGHAALEDAVRLHQLAAVQVLLKHGSNVNRPIAGGATVLDFVAHATNRTDQAIAVELRKHGAVSGLDTGKSD
jgi:hypothetical protein